ncbi:MAG: type IV pilus assembly protein PilM, partial [Candidatus Omnitrophica bacterium]|nr:type IV pilus assembly protein PilM [Candidatus Omnitrophota bacterium]
IELDRNLPHEEAALKILRQLAAEEKIKGGILSTSVSGQSVFVRQMSLPRVSERKMAQIIKYEAQQQVPFPIDDVAWDYEVFDQSDSPEVDVLLIAVKKDIVEGALAGIIFNKLEADYVDSTPLALYNAVNYAYKGDEGLIVLDIGCKSTNIIIIENNRMWTRSVPVAGNDITESLASNLNIDFDKAEELKEKHSIILAGGTAAEESIPNAREMSRAIALVLTDILTEVSRSISFYKSQYNQAQLNQILILGGSSKIKNIGAFFENNLDLKKTDVDLLENINIAGSIETAPCLNGDLNVMGVAIGQALRGLRVSSLNINLLPPEMIKLKEFRKKRGYIFVSGILAILIVFTMGVFALQGNEIDKIQYSTYKTAGDELEKYKKQIKDVRKKIAPIQKEVDTLVDINQRRSFWLKIALELTRVLPEDTWLIYFKPELVKPRAESGAHKPFPDFSLTIKGKMTNNLSSIMALREKFNQSAYFDGVEILYANYADIAAKAAAASASSTRGRGRGRRGRAAEPGTIEIDRAAADVPKVVREAAFSMSMFISAVEKEGEKEIASD